tara:strand:+ start:6216 stop:6416 length:201 start_codon:yes stop_codon:yes gene_type:complete
MIKNGKVEIGKTPCEETGKKSTVIKKGRALSEEVDVEDAFDKVAGYMDWDKWSKEAPDTKENKENA